MDCTDLWHLKAGYELGVSFSRHFDLMRSMIVGHDMVATCIKTAVSNALINDASSVRMTCSTCHPIRDDSSQMDSARNPDDTIKSCNCLSTTELQMLLITAVFNIEVYGYTVLEAIQTYGRCDYRIAVADISAPCYEVRRKADTGFRIPLRSTVLEFSDPQSIRQLHRDGIFQLLVQHDQLPYDFSSDLHSIAVDFSTYQHDLRMRRMFHDRFVKKRWLLVPPGAGRPQLVGESLNSGRALGSGPIMTNGSETQYSSFHSTQSKEAQAQLGLGSEFGIINVTDLSLVEPYGHYVGLLTPEQGYNAILQRIMYMYAVEDTRYGGMGAGIMQTPVGDNKVHTAPVRNSEGTYGHSTTEGVIKEHLSYQQKRPVCLRLQAIARHVCQTFNESTNICQIVYHFDLEPPFAEHAEQVRQIISEQPHDG